MKNIEKLREHKRFIYKKFNIPLSEGLSEHEKSLKKSFYDLSENSSDRDLDNAFLDFFSPMSLNASKAAELDAMNKLNIGICPECAEAPIGTDKSWPYSWAWSSGPTLYLCKDCYAEGQQMTEARNPKGKGCYIATVCYGNESANEVLVLKWYRDNILSKSFIGYAFIKVYYLVSPVISRLLQNKNEVNKIIRESILNRIVNFIEKREKLK